MDLKDEPLLLATNPRGLDYDVAKVLSEASFTPRIEATSNLDHIIFSMVQHHLGISIEAALMLTDKENAAVLRPFDPPQSRRLVMAARSFRTLSPAANQFVSHTKAALRKMEPDRIRSDFELHNHSRQTLCPFHNPLTSTAITKANMAATAIADITSATRAPLCIS